MVPTRKVTRPEARRWGDVVEELVRVGSSRSPRRRRWCRAGVVSRQDLEDLTKRGHLTLEAPPKSSLCGALMDDWEKSPPTGARRTTGAESSATFAPSSRPAYLGCDRGVAHGLDR